MADKLPKVDKTIAGNEFLNRLLLDRIVKNFHKSFLGGVMPGIAHNLRSPLGAVSLKTSALKDDIEESLNQSAEDPLVLYELLEETLKICNVILERVDLISSLIGNLMEFFQMAENDK